MRSRSDFRLFVLTLFMLAGALQAQVILITDVPAQTFYCPSVPKDTLNKIFIRGRVTKHGDPKTYIAKATIQLKNTDLLISSDSLGYYWLDISEISDAKNNYILQCSFANHQSVEKIIDHKIEKTTVIDFELMLNGGIGEAVVLVKDCLDTTWPVEEVKKKRKRWWRK